MNASIHLALKRFMVFELGHIHFEAMAATIEGDEANCDLVRTEGVEASYDQKIFETCIVALDDILVRIPHLTGLHKVYRTNSVSNV
jgi:hypothetical protein